MKRVQTLLLVLCVVLLGCALHAQEKTSFKPGAKVFISPMANDFHAFLKTAIEKKKVPVVLTDDKDKADFEIRGISTTQKAGAAKKALMWDWRSTEDASIQVIDLKTSEMVYGYNVHQQSSTHGRQSAAESCAKHLKERLEQGEKPKE